VFDTLNNIKGYRYELWCIAKAAGTRYCVLWVHTPAETCRAWNAARPTAEVRFASGRSRFAAEASTPWRCCF